MRQTAPRAGILAAVLIATLWAQTTTKQEYKVPGGARVVVLPAGKEPGRAEAESRMKFYLPGNRLACTLDYTSPDNEHGYGVEKAAWTPEGRYFVFSLTSSGGHQAWHVPTQFYSRKTGTVCTLDDYLDGAGISTSDFGLKAPNTVMTVIWAGKPIPVEVSLDALQHSRGKRRQPPLCLRCVGGQIVKRGP